MHALSVQADLWRFDFAEHGEAGSPPPPAVLLTELAAPLGRLPDTRRAAPAGRAMSAQWVTAPPSPSVAGQQWVTAMAAAPPSPSVAAPSVAAGRQCRDNGPGLSALGIAPAGYTCADVAAVSTGCEYLVSIGVGYLCGRTCGLDQSADCAGPPPGASSIRKHRPKEEQEEQQQQQQQQQQQEPQQQQQIHGYVEAACFGGVGQSDGSPHDDRTTDGSQYGSFLSDFLTREAGFCADPTCEARTDADPEAARGGRGGAY